MYQEIKPSKGISNVVDSFWTFSKNKTCENFKVIPDTCADLIFDLNNNKGFLSGVMTNYQLRELAPKSELIGVRFKIEKFSFLSKIPLDETKNLRIELADVFPTNRLKALNQLNNLEKITKKIVFLENFIETSFRESSQKQDEIVLSVAERIRTEQGIITIGDIAKSFHISLRQLERRFKSFMGLTLKEFSNIVRFNYAKKSIATLTKTSLLEIAYDFGFFDHSHMTYEFNRISGENPSFFR